MTFASDAAGGRLLRGVGDWTEQFDYFDDPLCRLPSYTVRASGHYVVVGDSESFDDPGRVVEVDFGVDRVSIVVWEPRLLETASGCGRDGGSWEVGVEREMTATGGCAALGVRAPTTSGAVVPQLLAAERRDKHVLLLVGQSATPPVTHAGSAVQRRPTSFQPPLRRCLVDDGDDAGPLMPDDEAWSDGRRDGGASASRTWRHVASAGTRHQVETHAAAAAATVWWIIIHR